MTRTSHRKNGLWLEPVCRHRSATAPHKKTSSQFGTGHAQQSMLIDAILAFPIDRPLRKESHCSVMARFPHDSPGQWSLRPGSDPKLSHTRIPCPQQRGRPSPTTRDQIRPPQLSDRLGRLLWMESPCRHWPTEVLAQPEQR